MVLEILCSYFQEQRSALLFSVIKHLQLARHLLLLGGLSGICSYSFHSIIYVIIQYETDPTYVHSEERLFYAKSRGPYKMCFAADPPENSDYTLWSQLIVWEEGYKYFNVKKGVQRRGFLKMHDSHTLLAEMSTSLMCGLGQSTLLPLWKFVQQCRLRKDI